MKKKEKIERLAFLLFVSSTLFIVFAYGVVVGRFRVFPYALLEQASEGYKKLPEKIGISKENPWYFKPVDIKYRPPFRNTEKAFQGLNLISRITKDQELVAELVDMEGRGIHEWKVDWFEIWPDANHLPGQFLPKSKPGTQINGTVIMENGDLVLDFDNCGLVRLDRDGKVVWRLPYQTHHSIHRHDDGNFWVCARIHHQEIDSRFPYRKPPFNEDILIEVTPDGKVVEEWSVADILLENGFPGFLFLGSLQDRDTSVPFRADLLHLNDVEPFPDSMEEGFFKKGDIMVSLRNVNTVFVFNRRDRKIKFMCPGWFIRQHDPDFIDGNRFSVFDNNNQGPDYPNPRSRIVIVSAEDNTSEVYFEGSEDALFYTDIMGRHQWLPNGNLLITESVMGRAFEITPQGEVVWEYHNYIDQGLVSLVEEVQRLPKGYEKIFMPKGFNKGPVND